MRQALLVTLAILTTAACGGVPSDDEVETSQSSLGDRLVKVSSFETDLSGWTSWQGQLTRVAVDNAPDGSYVARVTRTTGASFTIDDEPESVESTTAGRTYTATAHVRAASSTSVGRPIVLRITERNRSGGVVREVSSEPLKLSQAFQKVTMSLAAVNGGDTLGVRLSHLEAAQGSAFDVDLISLNESGSNNPGPGADPPEQRPFDPSHPVYQPIPDNCPEYVHSRKIVNLISSKYRRISFDSGSESPSVYVAKSSDPVWTFNIHRKPFKVHAPSFIQQGNGSDGPLVILDPSSSQFNGHPVEYRMWQVSINKNRREVTSNGGGVGVYANDGRILNDIPVQGGSAHESRRALGMAEIWGQNTGSGNSYTVGMIRPVDVRRGRIDHAIRIAIAYSHGKKYFWPATRTEPKNPTSDDRCPMGCRIFLDRSVDVDALANRVQLSNAKAKAFARIVLRAIQEYGFIALDGSRNGSNIYMEGDATADWTPLIGRKNGSGTYNDIGRAIMAVLPYNMLRVADGSVFARE